MKLVNQYVEYVNNPFVEGNSLFYMFRAIGVQSWKTQVAGLADVVYHDAIGRSRLHSLLWGIKKPFGKREQ